MPSVGPSMSFARTFRELAAAASVATAFVAALWVPASAHAQDKPKYQPVTDFRLSRASQAEKLAAAGRQSAAAGNCKRALDLFDQALRTSMDPLVVRDRGKCHDKEGNIRPAIDDYRAYLASHPDAPDTDAINERLMALDAQYAASDGKKRDPFASTAAGAASVERDTKNQERDADASERDRKRNYDAEVTHAQLTDEAYTSSLRRGKGGALGLQLGYRSLVGNNVQSLGGYLVGLSGRYAFSETVSGIAELGYGAYGASGSVSHYPVVIGFLGAEGRFPLDAFATHQIFAGGGLGIEHSIGNTSIDVTYYGVPRGRVGYRYLLASTVGIEAGLDAGLYYFRATTSTAGATVNGVATTVNNTEGRFFGSIGVLGGLLVGF